MPEMDEIILNVRKLHNEKLHDLYPSPDIIWVIKPRRKGWVGHVACMEDRINVCMVLVENIERDH